MVFVILERKNYFAACKVLKDHKNRTCLKYLNQVAEIRGRDLMFKRGKGPKNEIIYLRRTNIKVIMIIFT